MDGIRTVFLDRDGVINCRPGDGYVTSEEQFQFLDGVKQAITMMTDAGIRLFVVTNQRCIAHGLLTEAELARIHAKMCQELQEAGGRIQAVYHCPHHPDQCDCKKPKPGMLLRAQQEYPPLDFEQAVIVGDSLRDLQAGHAVGCRCILVGPEVERQKIVTEMQQLDIPLFGQANSLLEATVRFILPNCTASRTARTA